MFETYVPMGGFDEYMSPSHTPRKAMGALMDQLGALGLSQLNENHRAAEQLLKRLGATFRLYNNNSEASERILPFDPLPRLIDHQDWAVLEAGLIQRLEAIDLFLADIYGPQKIIKDGIISTEEITSSQGWRPQMQGFRPPLGRWC
ncbi:MAG: circularly permuted type 2 ATP-grasp protein, partial [Synechococcaceae bacterium WBB_34_004]|nr:circularly permuted type 2 ATP-grasp protein [Synechococcaceae bacterium WBB_34_004]